ncbi:MAG: cobyrinate a,c-diamide synthase [Desulfobulbaceae bacterium]|nr:cobyrinate a,c-diamide synthase [Desulfobulbaceae bacterium]HIJ79340.1 cobyrinate a,c-diamide synthase [Deltaproteobacteria bacterium]
MATSSPAIVVAGTQSGSGKTTITLGLLAALKAQGLKVQPFKCGPDFIDPSLHRLVTGRESRNLDLWMSGEEFVARTFALHSRGADISIIEGVMGMFDGNTSSSAALAEALQVPVVLILDVASAAESVAAVLKGFETLAPEVAPRAVILNRIGSERHLALVSEAIKKHCRAEIIGYLPRNLDFAIPGRHLGLKMGEEEPISKEAIARLAATITEHVDLNRLVALASENAGANRESGEQDYLPAKVKIGVARDQAFCFYYEDNLDLLRAAGAELVFFSPLIDRAIPAGVSGLYLGGGYPELFADKLAANEPMRSAIKAWAEAGRPIYAECGGFMYLSQGIVDNDDKLQPMAGVFPVTARMQTRRAALGYREIALERDCFLGAKGTVLRGHEFHYSTIDEMPDSIDRLYVVNNGEREGYSYKNVIGGYLHLHFGYNPEAVVAFVSECLTSKTK